jgi:hypothetical protein
MPYRRCCKDGYGVGAILSVTKGSIAVNILISFSNCLYAGVSDYQESAGSGLAAATQASADLLLGVATAILIIGVALIACSLTKPGV